MAATDIAFGADLPRKKIVEKMSRWRGIPRPVMIYFNIRSKICSSGISIDKLPLDFHSI
jgi:hypothetical protein